MCVGYALTDQMVDPMTTTPVGGILGNQQMCLTTSGTALATPDLLQHCRYHEGDRISDNQPG